MNEATARAIFLEYTTKPDFDRVHFLIRKEKESETPPRIFGNYILDAFNYYFTILQNEFEQSRAMGNQPTDWQINYWHLAPEIYQPGQYTLSRSMMPTYLEGIKQYINERCNLLPIITNGKTYRYHFDQNEIPENIIWDYKKWFDARPKFQLTDAALKQWQTDYNFFLSTRPNLRALLFAKGIEYAELLLNHCKEHEPTDLHQIDSLERRIMAAKRMAGIEATPASNKAAKVPNPRTTKRDVNELTAAAIALIHVFTNEPITMENMKKISERYKKPDGTNYDARNLYNTFMELPADRTRQKATKTLFNHYIRCITWLNSKGLKTAQKAAESELKQLREKQVND